MSNSTIRTSVRNALLELMKTKELERISVKDLVERANVSRATFYRYYESVDGVIEEIEDLFIEEMRDNSRYYLSMDFDLNDLEKAVPSILGIVHTVKKYKDFILAVSGPFGDPRFARRAQNLFVEFYAGKLAYEGIYLKDLDIYKEYAMAGQFAVTRYYLEKRQDLSDEEIALLMLNLLYAPFRK